MISIRWLHPELKKMVTRLYRWEERSDAQTFIGELQLQGIDPKVTVKK